MSAYYTSSGEKIVVIDKNLGGGEGFIFGIAGKSGKLAKIYKNCSDPSKIERKLRAMIAMNPEIESLRQQKLFLAWPEEILYENRICRGFVMPYFRDSVSLVNVYNPSKRDRRISWKNQLAIAGNIACLVGMIHSKGLVLCDINQKNFMVDANSNVMAVDVDSYRIKDEHGNIFESNVGMREYTPAEVLEVGTGNISRAPEHDCFGLAVMIFEILMDGWHPFRGIAKNLNWEPPKGEELDIYNIKNGIFPYMEKGTFSPPPYAPAFDILDPKIRELFIRCFKNGHKNPSARPSALEWARVLSEAEKRLVKCRNNERHYFFAHKSRCPWCERDNKIKAHSPTVNVRYEKPKTCSPTTPPLNVYVQPYQGANTKPARATGKMKIWGITAALIMTIVLGSCAWKGKYLQDHSLDIASERMRIENEIKHVDLLISREKFISANEVIKDELVWKADVYFTDSDKEKTGEIRIEEKKKLAAAVEKKLKNLKSREMNDKRYGYIKNELIPVIDSICRNNSKYKSFESLKVIDKKRHQLLMKRKDKIEAMIYSRQYDDARLLIKRLTHESDEKEFWLSIRTYREYWSDKREELMNRLQG